MSELTVLAADLTATGLRAGSRAADAVRETAMDVENLAKQLVPVKTGTLRRSIHHEVMSGGLEAEVGTDVEYAAAQEYGTYVMPPAPYLGPALDEMAPHFQARLAAIGVL